MKNLAHLGMFGITNLDALTASTLLFSATKKLKEKKIKVKLLTQNKKRELLRVLRKQETFRGKE